MDNKCEEILEEVESSMDRRHIKLEERLTERIEKAERKHELATLNCLKNLKFNEFEASMNNFIRETRDKISGLNLGVL
jgi:CHAD domain-containing protein